MTDIDPNIWASLARSYMGGITLPAKGQEGYRVFVNAEGTNLAYYAGTDEVPAYTGADAYKVLQVNATGTAVEWVDAIQVETISGMLLVPTGSIKTISSGAITVDGPAHYVDTEGAAPSDILTTISGGVNGQILRLSTVSSARAVQLTTAGNIYLGGYSTLLLNRSDQEITLKYRSSNATWYLEALSGAVPGVFTVGALYADTFQGLHLIPQAGTLVISSGEITVTGASHTIDTEGAAPSDTLTTISGGVDGQVLHISTVSASRTVTFSTAGNIYTAGLSITLSRSDQVARFRYRASIGKWYLEAFSGARDHGQLLGLSDDDHTQYVLANGTRAITGTQVMATADVTQLLATTLVTDTETTATISGGVVAVTASAMKIDTEGAAATDDLDQLTGGVKGQWLVLYTTNDARDVVVKHSTYIRTYTGADVTIAAADSRSLLYCRAPGYWSLLAKAS